MLTLVTRLSDIINTWRRDSLSLEPIRAMMGAGLADYLHIPFTYCWSPSLVPKPKDWAANIGALTPLIIPHNDYRMLILTILDVCGFFFRDAPDYSPPSELETFLKDGPTPIYIGFGSIVMDNPEKMSQIILEAVGKTGVRAIVSKGWSKLGTGMQDPNVFFLDECPHGRFCFIFEGDYH
jgi:sterol 3beta-glucosyltransferase